MPWRALGHDQASAFVGRAGIPVKYRLRGERVSNYAGGQTTTSLRSSGRSKVAVMLWIMPTLDWYRAEDRGRRGSRFKEGELVLIT